MTSEPRFTLHSAHPGIAEPRTRAVASAAEPIAKLLCDGKRDEAWNPPTWREIEGVVAPYREARRALDGATP